MRWGDGSYENEYGLKHQGQWQRDKMHGFGKQVRTQTRFNTRMPARSVSAALVRRTSTAAPTRASISRVKRRGRAALCTSTAISKTVASSRRRFFCNVLSMYTGHFFNNKKEGQGRLEDALGGVYEGQWLNNRREGQGTQTDRNGATYSGQWRDNKRAGQGSM